VEQVIKYKIYTVCDEYRIITVQNTVNIFFAVLQITPRCREFIYRVKGVFI